MLAADLTIMKDLRQSVEISTLLGFCETGQKQVRWAIGVDLPSIAKSQCLPDFENPQ